MLLNDRRILELAYKGMIQPYVKTSVREVDGRKLISYGVSSFGYDIRLSDKEFFTFKKGLPGDVIDPKNFSESHLERAKLHSDVNGEYFIIPGGSYGLGFSYERIEMPSNVTAICMGKSTYARTALMANITPLEACLSDDTEVLTRNGWKKIAEVIIGEEVLCLDNFEAKYQPVQDFHRYYFNGEMIHFDGKYYDQMVTPQHKIYGAFTKVKVKTSQGYSDNYPTDRKLGLNREKQRYWPFTRIQAKDVYGKHNLYFYKKVDWNEGLKLPETTNINGIDLPTKYWLNFIGAWLGDGSAFKQDNGNYVIKLAVVTKNVKRGYFREILDRLGFNYHESDWGFSFNSKSIYEFLKPYCGAYNKRIPREYLNLHTNHLIDIHEGLMMSDGCIACETYSTVSQGLSNDFYELCLKIGFNCSQWSAWKSFDKNKKPSLMHMVRYTLPKKYPTKVLPENHKKVNYSGFVYDLTVPSHVFLCRRNGKHIWTGNSWKGHITLEFSNDSPTDCRIYANEGVCQLLFFEGEEPLVKYSDRKCGGKYQNQEARVVLAKV